MDKSFRRNICEPLGPVYLLRTVRDQITVFQEKRGVLPQENNFLNVMAVMITQTGQAMYAVFTMFLALIPAATIFLHIVHFIIDRLLDISTTRKKNELWMKGAIFLLQLIVTFYAVRFVLSAIFLPILAMQTNILSKIFFFEDVSSEMYVTQNPVGNSGTFQDHICKPPIAVAMVPGMSFRKLLARLITIKRFIVSMIALPNLFIL